MLKTGSIAPLRNRESFPILQNSTDQNETLGNNSVVWHGQMISAEDADDDSDITRRLISGSLLPEETSNIEEQGGGVGGGYGATGRSSSIIPRYVKPDEVQRIRERLLRTRRTAPSPRPSSIRNFNRRQILALLSLSLVDFLSYSSMSIMAPFFPKEAESKGMPQSVCGFVFSFYALVMFLSAPIFGIVLPRVGAKFLFISGLMVAGVCNVLFGFLDSIANYTTFVVFCFLIRGLEALGASAFSTASYTFVVEIFPDNIGSVLGILETFVGLGMSAGPALGGFLYSVGGFGLPFYVLGGILVAISPINFCLIPSVDDCKEPPMGGSIIKLMKIPAVIVIGLVVVVASSCSFLDPTLEPHLRQFNLSTKQVGLLFLLFSALYGICSPFWGCLADKTNSHWLMMSIGLSVSSVGLAIMGPTSLMPFLPNSLWINILSLCVLSISVSLTMLPTFQSILTSVIQAGYPDELSTHSMVAGYWSCVYSLGEVVGPSLGGVILQRYGFEMCSTLMAGLNISLAVITVFFFTLRRGDQRGDSSRESTPKDSGFHTSGSFSCSAGSSAQLPNSQNEDQSLLAGHGNKMREQAQRYADSRANGGPENNVDWNKEVTDFRGTVNVTAYGACEV